MNKFQELIKWVESEIKTANEYLWCDKGKIYLEVYTDILNRLKEAENEIKTTRPLIVEDGSVDIDKLEKDGFYVINYRSGSKPPMWLTHQHEDKGE